VKPPVKRLTRAAISAIVREPHGPRPSGPLRARLRGWHERAYFHLSRAEWDARVKLGVSLWHPDHVAAGPVPPELQRLEWWLWPCGEWTDVIEEHWREDERRRGR
jgi:hypothetical protein